MLAGAAGIGAQRPALDDHRALQFDALDGGVAHVTLADRHGAGFSVLARPAAPAAALDALDDEAPPRFWVDAEEHHSAAEESVVAGGHAILHGGTERLDDGVDDGRDHHAPAGHRRGIARHHDVALGDDHVERAERAFVDRFERAGQRLVGDARARIGARVDSRLALARAAGQIDRHAAMVDRDFGREVKPLVALDAVIVKERACLIDAILQLFHDVAALALGFIEDLRDGVEDRVLAVFVEQLVHAPYREPAGRHLRFHVAERGFRGNECCP